jgi:hypothetical protein
MKKIKNKIAALVCGLALLIGNVSTANAMPSEPKEQAKETCFNFKDSCGGAWNVCYTGDLGLVMAWLFEWDGGC